MQIYFQFAHNPANSVNKIKKTRKKHTITRIPIDLPQKHRLKHHKNTDLFAYIMDNKHRNPKIARQILRSYARNISTLAKKTSILEDITSSKDIGLSMDTFDDYIAALERLFVIQDIDAWCPAIRSKTAIRSASKRCFVDSSIAVAAMNINAVALETQLKTKNKYRFVNRTWR